jgi:hypothetical protein
MKTRRKRRVFVFGNVFASSAPPGLDGRHRDVDGQIRHKNGNTRVYTLRGTYGEDFAQGYRGDMKLETLLDRTRVASLTEYLKRK